MKKIISALLTVLLIGTMAACSFGASAASVKLTATTEQQSYKPGDIAAISVLVKNNPGFWGLDYLVYFDNTALQINTITNGNLFLENEGWINVGKTTYIDSYNNKGAYHYVGMCNSLYKEIETDGVLFNISFKIDEKAKAGSYEIKMQLGTGVIIDKDGNKIEPTFENAKINVEGTIEDNPEPVVPTVAPTKVVAVTDAQGQPVPEKTTMITDANGKQQSVVVEYKTEVVENIVETGSPREVVSSKAAAGAFDNEGNIIASQVENKSNGNNNNNATNQNGSQEETKAKGNKSGGINTLLIIIIIAAVVIVAGLGVLLFVVNKKNAAAPNGNVTFTPAPPTDTEVKTTQIDSTDNNTENTDNNSDN